MNAVYGSLLDEKNIPTSIFLYLNQKKILYKKIQYLKYKFKAIKKIN